ncbi:PQQ-binding-like beta-propeller repeat protein [Botrimarina mediterranea]|uniref:PEP-CTERM protein-sorting domain-containing protein n=1 Tax=Botrimarina mediterranea TaxID=2528022 RepID=A0A518KBR1_9BACT|nr:PQQ-binding-like beta-propeller repeat protein [Botrimarina mediterranea]QDV75236.1 hypothetical protein Spa11_34500 [Botrimarina mediterranea]QDV79905.1 hypothetical protein K2D_35250 [Planctomycetes bacterium K2D]
MPMTIVRAAIGFSLLLASSNAQSAVFEFVRQLPGSTATGYDFGLAVDTDGVLVAATSLATDPSPGATAGAGYVFAPENGDLVNRLYDSTSSTGDAYGFTIAIDGDRTIVGAPRGASQSDTVYLFDHTTGAVLAKPTGDVRLNNSFGASIAMDQGIAIVGSPGESIAPRERGAVYVYDAADGSRLRKITSGDSISSAFGQSVALNDGLALIGSPRSSDVGLAHLYDAVTGNKIADYSPEDDALGDNFGFQVAIADGVALVGAPTRTVGSRFGSAYLFDVATGQQIAKLSPKTNSRDDGYGQSVAIDDGIALVGGPRVGEVYVFDARTGTELSRIISPEGVNSFGSSLAFRDGLAVIGASSRSSAPGTAFIYRLTIPEPGALLLALAAVSSLALRRR